MPIFIGKVLEDKGDKIVLEIGKDDQVEFDIKDGDQFYSLVFVSKDEGLNYNPFPKQEIQ